MSPRWRRCVGGCGQPVWGQPVSESLSSQLLLPVPKTVLSLAEGGGGGVRVESKDPEILPGRLTGKEALEEVRGTRRGKRPEL